MIVVNFLFKFYVMIGSCIGWIVVFEVVIFELMELVINMIYGVMGFV